MNKVLENPITITRVWRAEIARVTFFIVASVLSPVVSSYFPKTVIAGRLFSIDGYALVLHLPVFWLLPAAVFVLTAIRIYNCRYTIDDDGVESREGILSFRQSITRFRHFDIRSMEVDQTILERILDVGTVEIGTAATGEFEASLDGIGSPKKVQQLLQGIREARLKIDDESEQKHELEPESLVGAL